MSLHPETHKDVVLFVQKFQQDLVLSKQLLINNNALPGARIGNISLRIPGEERLVIASLSDPQPDTVALLNFDLQSDQENVSDNLKEVAALHVAIYRERPEANAIIHTHSHYLTAFSIARQPLPAYTNSLLGSLNEDQSVPVANWGPRYSTDPVVAALRENPHTPAVLLANHGPFAWSSGGVLSVSRLLVNLEEAAYLTFLARQLGGAQSLPYGAAEQVRKGWVSE